MRSLNTDFIYKKCTEQSRKHLCLLGIREKDKRHENQNCCWIGNFFGRWWIFFKTGCDGQFRTLVALVEDVGLIPSTNHLWLHFQGSPCPLLVCRCMVCTWYVDIGKIPINLKTGCGKLIFALNPTIYGGKQVPINLRIVWAQFQPGWCSKTISKQNRTKINLQKHWSRLSSTQVTAQPTGSLMHSNRSQNKMPTTAVGGTFSWLESQDYVSGEKKLTAAHIHSSLTVGMMTWCFKFLQPSSPHHDRLELWAKISPSFLKLLVRFFVIGKEIASLYIFRITYNEKCYFKLLFVWNRVSLCM